MRVIPFRSLRRLIQPATVNPFITIQSSQTKPPTTLSQWQHRSHTTDKNPPPSSSDPHPPPPPPPVESPTPSTTPPPPPTPRPQKHNPKNHTNHLLPPRPTLPDHDLKHTYLKGSGPGGQKINKTSSAVQLTHLPTGIVVKSQATRSRRLNHDLARRILAEKVEVLEKGGESRVEKKRELVGKRKGSADKKKRRKYRKLEEEKQAMRGNGGEGREEEEEGR